MFEQTFELGGREQKLQPLVLQSRGAVLIIAMESGVDAFLGVASQAGTVLADSSIRRSGVQRVVMNPTAEPLTLQITGKDDRDAHGRVRVVVRGIAEPKCRAIMEALSNAEQAYAAAEQRTLQIAGAPAGNAGDDYKRATQHYLDAVRLVPFNTAPALIAETLHAYGAALYQGTREWAQSDTVLAAATTAYAAAGNEYGSARATALQAAALMETAMTRRGEQPGAGSAETVSDQLARARALLERASAFHLTHEQRYEAAQARNNIGLSFYYQGSYDEALQAYESALSLYKAIGARSRQAQVTQNIALTNYELGKYQAALAGYEQALSLLNRRDTPKLYAEVLTNCGLINRATGRLDQALRQHGEALDIFESIHSEIDKAWVLHGIALVYYSLGERQSALGLLEQALAIRTPQLDARGRASSLRAAASIQRELGNVTQALQLHQQALSLASSAHTRGRIQVEIAIDLAQLGRQTEAREVLDALLRQPVVEGSAVAGYAFLERGRGLRVQGHLQEAAADLQHAADTLRRYEFVADAVDALTELARVQRAQGLGKAARDSVDLALRLSEEVRGHSGNPELRAQLFEPLRPTFDLKISLLREDYEKEFVAGRITAARDTVQRALQVAESARARTLGDYLGAVASRDPAADPRGVADKAALYAELATLRYQLAIRTDRSGVDDPRARIMRAQIALLRRKMDVADGPVSRAPGTTVVRMRNANIALARIPADTVLVEYWLGTEHAWAWAVSRRGIDWIELGSPVAIESAARTLYTALAPVEVASNQATGAAPAATLADFVLRPVAAALRQHERIVFLPDGALHFIPFAVLPTGAAGGQVLIESHEVATAASLRLLLADDRPRTLQDARSMLLIADPVYDASDSRLERSSAPLSAAMSAVRRGAEGGLQRLHPAIWSRRLPGTHREAEAIAKAMAGFRIDRIEGFAATRASLMNDRVARYRYIHLALHAFSDPDLPQLSALLVSTFDRDSQRVEGEIWAGDLLGLRLDADLVVLSACETALGREVSGEGLMGLQYATSASGAAAVVASLWKVPDSSSVTVFTRFYQALGSGATPVKALATAMRAELPGNRSSVAQWGGFTVAVANIERL